MGDICQLMIYWRDLELDEIIIYNKNCYINNKDKKLGINNTFNKYDNKFCFTM